MRGVDVSARLNTKLAELFRFSGVFGISVPDNRRELLVIGPGYLEIYLLCFLYLAGVIAVFAVSSSAFSAYINFDDVAADIRATSLTYGDLTVTGGYSDNFNLADCCTISTFSMDDIISADVVQDTNGSDPTYGGLGVESGLASSSDDNLQGSIGGDVNTDEIMFFEFDGLVDVGDIYFNGDHTDLVNSEMLLRLFTSTDGETYTAATGNVAPIGGDYLNAGFTTQYFAIAAVGPVIDGDTGAYVASIEYRSVPEPATLALLGLGLAGLAGSRRRKNSLKA